jgi:hypothetical protein
VEEAKTKKRLERDITAAEKALQEAKPILKKLLIIRHNLFAHRSASLSYEKAFKKAAITPNEIRRLTEIGIETINLLRTALGQTDYVFSELPSSDLKGLLGEINPGS